MKIKIVIWSYKKNYSIYADDVTGEFTFGLETKAEGAKTFVKQAIDIVKGWPDRLEDLSRVDGISYKIAYEDESEARQLVGANKTPENFTSLMYLINKNEPNNHQFLSKERERMKEIEKILETLEL